MERISVDLDKDWLNAQRFEAGARQRDPIG